MGFANELGGDRKNGRSGMGLRIRPIVAFGVTLGPREGRPLGPGKPDADGRPAFGVVCIDVTARALPRVGLTEPGRGPSRVVFKPAYFPPREVSAAVGVFPNTLPVPNR